MRVRKTKGHISIINGACYRTYVAAMSLARWFKVADASMMSKSDEGALKEAKNCFYNNLAKKVVLFKHTTAKAQQ